MNNTFYPLKECNLILSSDSFIYATADVTVFAVIEGHLAVPHGQTLTTGSIFCCFPGSISFHTDSHCVLLCLKWDNRFLLEELPGLTAFPADPLIFDADDELFCSLKSYAHLRLSFLGNPSKPPADIADTRSYPDFRTKSLSFLLLEHMTDLSGGMNYPGSDFIPGASRSEQVLKEVLDYVLEHMTDALSLSSVAEHFSLTPQYLAGLFKKYCHVTFQTYLLSFRSHKAEAYLTYTDMTVPDIVHRLHLKTCPAVSHEKLTNRNSYEMPVRYSILSPETALTYLTDLFQPDAAPLASNHHKTVDTTSTSTPLFPVWKQLINLGYAANFNSSRIFRQLTLMQERIGYRYGRLCRIFDLITSYSAGEKVLYDFNPAFRILDTLINNHMYPFLELGNKRLRIQLTLRDSLIPDVPKESEEYFHYLLEMLPSFICACINRYGYESLTHWKFEVCFPNYESYGNIDDFPVRKYVDFFMQIQSCIHSYLPECQIGGPGFNNWADPDSFEKLLEYFKVSSIRPDFLTGYLYSIIQSDDTFIISSGQDIMKKRMIRLKEIAQSVFPECELWITEFNSNLSSRNHLNDSSYQAAFIAHNMLTAAYCGITAMGYYLMSDTPLRYADTFDMLFGGWGLLTDSSIPKPSFHAMHLLSMLGSDLLLQADHMLVTGSGHEHKNFQCLIYHSQDLALDYCSRNIAKDDFLHPDVMFQPQSPDSWEITFLRLIPGYYLIRQYTISPSNGNVLFQWHQIHFLTPDKEQDYDLIRQLSEIPLKPDCIKVTEHNGLTLRCTLSRQEIDLFTIDYFHPLTQKE